MLKAWDAKKKELDDKYPEERSQIGSSTVEEWNPSKSSMPHPSEEGGLAVVPDAEAEHKAAMTAID